MDGKRKFERKEQKEMKRYKNQLFEGSGTSSTAYDSSAYCDFSSASAKAIAGKDILVAFWNADGSKILAVAGQQSLTINRSADTIEVTTKDTDGGWKAYIAGTKEWSIDVGGIFVKDDESHRLLSGYFEDGEPVCIKVYNNKTKAGMFGGLAVITDYPLEAPHDDSMTYSMSFSGMGALVDFSKDKPATDTLPE